MNPSRTHVLKEAKLLKRLAQVLPNGPLLDYKQAFGEQELKAPNAARSHCGYLPHGGSFESH